MCILYMVIVAAMLSKRKKRAGVLPTRTRCDWPRLNMPDCMGPTGNNATQLDTTGCSHWADYLSLTVEMSRANCCEN